MSQPRGFGAVDLQRAQNEKVNTRLSSDEGLRRRWAGVVADAFIAERNMAKLKRALREVFHEGDAIALDLLQRDAEAIVDARPVRPPTIPNPDANKIEGSQIASRQTARA